MRLHLLLCVAVLILLCLKEVSFAQADPRPEEFIVSFDKAFYAAGEDIWYSIQFQQADHPSNVVYIELIAPDGTYLSRQTILSQGQIAPGDIALNPNLPTAYYEFRAYTSWNLNFSPQVVFRTYLPIYHPRDAIIADVPPPDNTYLPAQQEEFVFSRIELPLPEEIP